MKTNWSIITSAHGIIILYINLFDIKHWYVEKSYHEMTYHS